MAFLEGAKEHTDLSLAVRRKLHAAVLNLLDRGLDCLDQGDESVGDVFVFPCFGGYGEELFQKLRRYFAGEKIGDGHVLVEVSGLERYVVDVYIYGRIQLQRKFPGRFAVRVTL